MTYGKWFHYKEIHIRRLNQGRAVVVGGVCYAMGVTHGIWKWMGEFWERGQTARGSLRVPVPTMGGGSRKFPRNKSRNKKEFSPNSTTANREPRKARHSFRVLWFVYFEPPRNIRHVFRELTYAVAIREEYRIRKKEYRNILYISAPLYQRIKRVPTIL